MFDLQQKCCDSDFSATALWRQWQSNPSGHFDDGVYEAHLFSDVSTPFCWKDLTVIRAPLGTQTRIPLRWWTHGECRGYSFTIVMMRRIHCVMDNKKKRKQRMLKRVLMLKTFQNLKRQNCAFLSVKKKSLHPYFSDFRPLSWLFTVFLTKICKM